MVMGVCFVGVFRLVVVFVRSRVNVNESKFSLSLSVY